MAKNGRGFSLSSRGLKHKLRISVALMSILPILVSAYIVSSYIFLRTGPRIDVILFLSISIIIALIGFFVIKEVFDRVLSVTSEAKMIASGDFTRKSSISSSDEVGELGESLNRLTQRIRGHMEELKIYSERTTEINLGIQKRVVVLSGLLQISSQISQTGEFDAVLNMVVEKVRLLAGSDLAFLFLREENQEAFTLRAAEGIDADSLEGIKIDPADDIFHEISKKSKTMVLDNKEELNKALTFFVRQKLKLKNTMIIPVSLRERVVALLGIGNMREDFIYPKEDAELLDVFAKQVAIAVENDILLNNVKKLEIKDALTGLYNESFMYNRLQEEIKRAIVYRRPCAYILLDIDNFKKYNQSFGSLYAESAIKRISSLIAGSVSEIDRVGRIGDDAFAVILPEKNKRQAQEIAEGIRKKIAFAYSEEKDAAKKITVSAGVSENPLDGITSGELVNKAKELLQVAKQSGRNRVVIF